jgi:hypothetical protein
LHWGIGDSAGNYDINDQAVGVAINDSKWHHHAATYDGTTFKAYADGKLVYSEVVAITRNNVGDSTVYIGTSGGNEYFTGSVDEVRIWDDDRTQIEIRANMFSAIASATEAGLLHQWSFDEGTGTTDAALDTCTNTTVRPLTMVSGSWAAGGTFTYGTSTLVMSGSSKSIYTLNGDTFAAATFSGSTTLVDIDGNNHAFYFEDDLTVTGTLTSTSNEYVRFSSNFTDNSGALNLSGTVTGVKEFVNASNANINIPAHTTQQWNTYDGSTSTQTGNVTLTKECDVASGGTWNVNGNTLAALLVDVNGGTLNLSNSVLNFSVSATNDGLDMTAASTLTTGNTTITGYASATKTPATLPAAGGFEVVGDVKWLEMQSDADLTVIGAVVACSMADSTANIRQWHHTLDTQQLLDADSGSDDDLKLERPALDNALELMTG